MPNPAELLQRSADWLKERAAADPGFLNKFSDKQHPDVLYIGCSDSRVIADSFLSIDPGEMFVHRNIANVVNGLDHSAASVINYAVVHLGVKHIVVCGHYGCGGVQAAITAADLGPLNSWVRSIRDVYRLHAAELDAVEESKRWDRLVQLNVQEQCINVLKFPEVRQAVRERGLTVHGWVFDLRKGNTTGKIEDLNLNAQELMTDIEKIYDLGSQVPV